MILALIVIGCVGQKGETTASTPTPQPTASPSSMNKTPTPNASTSNYDVEWSIGVSFPQKESICFANVELNLKIIVRHNFTDMYVLVSASDGKTIGKKFIPKEDLLDGLETIKFQMARLNSTPKLGNYTATLISYPSRELLYEETHAFNANLFLPSGAITCSGRKIVGIDWENVPQAAPFFTAYNESEANKLADKLGVKYVITDVESATYKFCAMAAWAKGTLDRAREIYYVGKGYVYITPKGQLGVSPSKFNIPAGSRFLTVIDIPSENYFKTMQAKLYIMEGNGLKHYRMIYESGFESRTNITIEMLYRYIYDWVYASKLNGSLVPVTSTGYVKVFEYVKGAKITGKVGGSVKEVKISANITTNQHRTFVYRQTAKVVNGSYEFVVPYAQRTTYPVKVSEYKITAGNETRVVSLSDDDVENGRIIVVDFI